MKRSSVFCSKYGPWGVVTGGTRGVGRAIVNSIASRGLNVVIIGTRNVTQVAEEVSTRFQVQTRAVQADLGIPTQVAQVMEECRDLSVGLFCCNHASTHLQTHEQFRLWLDTSEDDLDATLQINVASSVRLMYHFAQKMRSVKRGGIIIVSSLAAKIGNPYLAQYAAAKAFLTTLGTTLWWELRKEGIDVTTILPGGTKTPAGLKCLNEKGRAKLPLMSPEQVAETAICALGKKIQVIPGVKNNIDAFMLSALPKRFGMWLLDKVMGRFFSIYPIGERKLGRSRPR